MRTQIALLLAMACGLACSSTPVAHPQAAVPTGAAPSQAAAPAVAASPEPTRALPAYYIESLRPRIYSGGRIEIKDEMFRGAGFTKSNMTWPSGRQTMTGTISMPDGPGPFPVVIVNHGHIPAERYWIGQDSGIFGDPMASHGFISLAPNYPGYSGSGPGDTGLPAIEGEAVTVMDLISSLSSLPQADPLQVAMIGHSNGGGVTLIAMVTDPRVRVVALYAPVSSDMADNARKWWLGNGSAGPLGSPTQNPQGYAHISPRNYFAAGQAPAIMLQGTADQDIPAAWTQSTYDALQAQGIQSRLIWYPGAQHDLVGADLNAANAAAESWIRSGLGI